MRAISIIVVALALSAGRVSAQTADMTAPTATNNPPPALVTESEKAWSFAVSASTYIVPDSRDYVQPTLSADRGRLHLEARYNYEALDTGSAWLGCNFSGGEKLAWEFTPMVGGILGETDGFAPGYKGSLSWWKLELYSEGEYVFNRAGADERFFYNWAELSLAPADWVRFGFVSQRTRAYESDVDIQRGFLVGFSCRKASVTTYVFNPDESKPTVVVAVALSF